MVPDPADQVALLVLRCWCEDRSPTGFRAHLTVVEDLAVAEASVSWTSSVDDVMQAVRALLKSVGATPS